MPIRRQSASQSPAPAFSTPTSSTRNGNGNHQPVRDNETWSLSDMPKEAAVGEGKVIGALVQRIVNKLPCNSGTRLGMMEIDQGVRQTVVSLLNIVKIRPAMVIHALSSALETLSKYSSSSASDTPLDTLHSQLYLLHLLFLALSSSWRAHAEAHPPPPGDLPRAFPDPPALDDVLARYLLAVTLIYARVVSAEAGALPGTSSPAPSRDTKGTGTSSSTSLGLGIAPGSGSNPLGPKFIQRHSFPSGSNSPLPPHTPKLLAAECGSTHATIYQMTKTISRIIFYLSASNWPLLLARIKARISFLQTTIEDSPDLVELRLLEWSNLNRTRLSQTLQEISSTFLHVKRPAQISIASVLRKAIWSWIEVHPSELDALVSSNRNIEGGAEILFDVLHSASDITTTSHARRTRAFYPLMAMLLVICPDMFKKAAMGDMGSRGSGGLSKKLSFLESLRKGINSSKGFEACVICYVDIVRAAMYVSPRLESSGVRSIIPDIQSDLRNALFYSSMGVDISDPNILVDGLVALYRTNPISVTSLLFGKLFADSSEVNRVVAIKACQVIQVEDARLPWFPPVSDLRDRVASAVRSVLKTQAAAMLGDVSVPRRPRAHADLPSSQNDLLYDTLQLYILDPSFVFAAAISDSTDSLASILQVLSTLMISPSPDDIRGAAARVNVALLEAMATEDEAILEGSAHAIWQLHIDASRQGLHAVHHDPEDINNAFNALRDVSVALATFCQSHPDFLASSPRGEAAALAGMVAVVTVSCSPDFEQLAQTVPTLKALKTITLVANRSFMPGESPAGTNFGSPERRLAMRIKILGVLANLPPANGRQQQQRQYRRVYKPYALPSTGGVAMWLGLAHYGKVLTSRIIAAEASATNTNRRRGLQPDIDGLDEGQSKAWQNVTLFLASTAAVCQYDSVPPPPLTDIVGKGVLPKLYEEFQDPIVACDGFLRECVDLLISHSIHVRETVKEALGSELPGSLLHVVVSHMTKLLSHSVGSNGVSPSETFTTFADQVLVVLRLNIDRLVPGEQNAQVDLGEIISLLLAYTHRLGRDETNLRIRIKLCQLVETVLSRNECIVLSNEAGLKNNLLETMVEWAIEAQRDGELHRYSDTSTKTYREVEQSALKALVPVTEGLSLRPGAEETEANVAVKTRLFHRYYSYLVKVLERSNGSEVESLHGSSHGLNRSTVTLDDAASLALASLSNLLSANLDVGLKHCLALGYHEDPSLRTAFMRLLTSILQRGARFGGLATKRLSSAPRVFLDLLTQDPNNLALAVAICESCGPSEVDEMSSMLCRVFEGKGNFLGLVKMLAEREIAQTTHESDLFRANTLTTRILTIFAKTYGYNYVRATLQPLVHSLVEKPAECSFELDPSKAAPGDDIERNADHLQLMCQALLDLICASTSRAPIMFRAFCHHLWETTADRFPESRHSVIGSFIFLRFFCPAIVAPETIDLDVSPDTREVRRALLLITKVIQNLANNVIFGNKEPHMKVLNGFLGDNIRQVSKFLSEMAVRPRAGDVAEAVGRYVDEQERAGDMEGDEAVLQRFLAKNLAKVESSLASMPTTYRCGPGGSTVDRVDVDGKKVLGDLKKVWDRTGGVADGKGMSASARSLAYDEFMRHNAGRNVESVANAFYEGPVSQNGRRIFYFIVSRVGLLDYDLLAYHVFSIIDKITDFFDLVIDLTDFSASTELPLAWLKRSIQMCPPGVLPCVNTLALYNPNGYARRRVRRIAAELLSAVPPVGKTVIAASSPAELAEFIPFTSLALPEYTMALAYEAEHVFTNLLCLSDHEQQVPVVVKLGHDCMQIASWRKQELTPTVKSYIIDVVRLRDIDDIITGGSLPTDHLLIKYGQNESVTFISRKRNEMAQIIRAARSRLRDGPSEERSLRPSDVPGTLLNVALLNLSSGDESLRLGAYNLIYELSGFFKWELALSVLKVTAGLNIPHNALAFSYSLSSALSQSAPHLTLEFFREWTIGFSRGDISQKCAALHYIGPWLSNLEAFVKPTREKTDLVASRKTVGEIIRGLVSVTVTERRRLHLSIHEHVWSKIAGMHEALVEIAIQELVHLAIDAGFGSEKSECAADVLVSMGGTVVRGRVIARLRKIIAQTYLKPSSTLMDNIAWPEISTLSRIVLALSFNPTSALDAQLFLPELLHIITLLLGTGPLLLRQTVYGLAVNTVQSLASSAVTGEMDTATLQRLLKRLQSKEMVGHFGLVLQGTSFEVLKGDDEALLNNVEEVAKFLGEVLAAGATSMDCANAWRARWMGLVAATCFQHNPATQPQAFTVLGHLAQDEVDDDIVYQILVAMSTTLVHFAESDNILLISMLRCLCRVIPGLLPDSRYAGSLFWVAIAILQLGSIPPFAAACEMVLVSLRSIFGNASKTVSGEGEGGETKGAATPMMDTLLEARRPALEPARRLDNIAGVSFDSDPGFSFVGVIYKGVRHPGTRKLATEVMVELLRICQRTGKNGPKGRKVVEDGVGMFMALLPLLAGAGEEEVRGLFGVVGVEVPDHGADGGLGVDKLKVLDLLTLPDNSTALLLVTLVTTILQTASSEAEKIVLYRFLAEASVEMPEVVAMAYDSLIPRMTSVLSTTTTLPILEAVSTLLETALRDTNYTFPQTNLHGESSSSLQQSQSGQFGHGGHGAHGSHGGHGHSHAKTYSASISSMPSVGLGSREQVLDDLGMRGLGELSFTAGAGSGRGERVAIGAKWVAALIEAFTS